MSSKIKVYELAKELGLDSQQLVDVIQRLGVDIKNSMSVLGSEEVRTIRDYYRKQKGYSKAAAPSPTKGSMTEKRVGTTVIRRRAAAKPSEKIQVEMMEQTPFFEEDVVLAGEGESSEVTVSEVPVSETELAATPVEATATPVEAAAPVGIEAKETTGSITEAPEEVSKPTLKEPKVYTPILKTSSAPKAPIRTVATATPAAKPPVSAPPAKITATASVPGVEKKLEAKAPPQSTLATPIQVITPPPPPPKRRVYQSIIKKVSTDQHLRDVIGPKPVKVDKPKEVAKPATTGTDASKTGAVGLKRGIKEIDFAPPSTEAAKEAGKRRVLARQDTVFKSADYLKRELIHSTKKRKTVINRPAMKTLLTTKSDKKKVVQMGATIKVAEFAKELGVKAGQVIPKLMALGVPASINESIDYDTAVLCAHEFGYEVKQEVFKTEDYVGTVDVSAENVKPRPPVVTIMGHVDHGKTSLLDAIRKTKVAAKEAGGITQHIGAYTVTLPKGKISFVDTPGHEAFTAMRARGAKVTDIVVLVVSAVDGVMPQTMESIAHAKAAAVPIIVAVNKVDLPDGNPDRIKQTLSGQGLNPEEWGGDTIYVNVSAKTGVGLDQLLESILLQAEILELTANYDTPARGTVIESRLDKNRGAIATILVQHGVLRPGDSFACGESYGKVRAMSDSFGQRMLEAFPSDPVEILGLPSVPNTGDDLWVVKDEKTAREIAGGRVEQHKARTLESRPKLSIEEMMAAAAPGGEKELRVILKSDVQGSGEALREAMSKFPQTKVRLKILHVGTGGITESDVMLATASKAVVLGFNVRPDLKAQKIADAEQIEIRSYTIIYDLLEDVKKFLEGLVDSEIKEKVIGRAEVRNVFNIPKIGTIAGSAVIDGKVTRGCFLRLLRDNRVIYTGKVSSLKRFKEDVKEVAQGFECGIGLENFNDLKMGDQFEAFVKEEIKGTL
jgi:translation initiation factor IF-2